VFGWFVTIRDLQSWLIPCPDEDKVLEMSMAEIMVNLRQMKMEKNAKIARLEFERNQERIKRNMK